MNPGRLRYQGVLQSPSVSAGTDGEPTPEWTAYATVMCGIETSGGREFWAARQINSEINTRIVMWRRNDVLSGHQMVVGSRTFDVLWVDNGDQHLLDTILYCREVNASVA